MCWRFLREWRTDALVRLGHREREVEPRSLPRLAFDPDPATVCFDDSLGNGQSESGAHALGAFGLPVWIEDVAEMLAGDSRSGVADREQDFGVARLGVETNHPSARRELHRVPDQVPQDLQKAMAIRERRRKLVCDLVLQRDSACRRLRLK